MDAPEMVIKIPELIASKTYILRLGLQMKERQAGVQFSGPVAAQQAQGLSSKPSTALKEREGRPLAMQSPWYKLRELKQYLQSSGVGGFQAFRLWMVGGIFKPGRVCHCMSQVAQVDMEGNLSYILPQEETIKWATLGKFGESCLLETLLSAMGWWWVGRI